jgi:hypothetical protein
MSAPSLQSYKDVAVAFGRGELDFEGLMQAVKALPPPLPRQKRIRSLEEVYLDADEPTPPDSALWLGGLYSRGLIEKEQLMLLIDAAKVRPEVTR